MAYNYAFKFVIVGDSNCGKTCILLKYTDNKFEQNHDMTIGVEFATRIIDIDNLKIKLQIWDTAGQDTFRSITRSYYRGAACALIVFDITNRLSFLRLHDWLEEIRKTVRNDDSKPLIVLVANKCDLEHRRDVSREECEEFARRNDLRYYEISAKTGVNLEKLFLESAKYIKDNKLPNQISSNSVNVNPCVVVTNTPERHCCMIL